MADAQQHYPWSTPPTGVGETECGWCHRMIYRPALPCSVQPIEGLLRAQTRRGQGERCKYELASRRPDLLREPLAT